MKKIFALLLALCMIFALAACGEPAQKEETEKAEEAEAAETVEKPPLRKPLLRKLLLRKPLLRKPPRKRRTASSAPGLPRSTWSRS